MRLRDVTLPSATRALLLGGLASLALLTVLASLGCKDARGKALEGGSAASASAQAQKPGAAPKHLNPYEPGKWRLSPPGELEHVVLWVSHVLIRHDGATRQAPFGAPGWEALPPAPRRSRDQALEIARKVAREAQEQPARFEELARTWSEDAVTRAHGGSLGGVRASDLQSYPAILDALAALGPGQVSTVVETRFGFHVLHRRPVPPEAQVTGRRIVLGYAGAKYLGGNLRPGRELPKRSHAEALSLAETVSASLRDGTATFEALLERDSDHQDVAQGGDIGSWSTREAGEWPREREALARLAVGEVSAPIDSAIGVQVYVRTEATPRPEVAMATLRFPFAEVPAGEQRSRPKALELAESVARTLVEQPGRFAAFQAEYCCAQAARWTEGRRPAVLTRAVSSLSVGAIARTPLELDSAFLLPRRLDPAEVPAPPAATFELPTPALPDVLAFARKVSGAAVQKLLGKLRDEAPSRLGLDEKRAADFRNIHDALAALFAPTVTAADREKGVAARLMELRALLTPEEYDRYWSLLQDTIAANLMKR